MSKPTIADAPSSWTSLQNDFELRETVKFSVGILAEDSSFGNGTISHDNVLPSLPPPTRNRKILLVIGLVLASLDLCILPITYFYSLTFGTKLSRQTVFIVITCLFCMMMFAHYTHRCIRLIHKCSSRYGPIGWQRRFRLLEFTNVNFAICASIFETLIVIGTAPTEPILRLVAMPSATICYYFGTLFLVTAFLTQKGYRLPFEMSSTPKGALWRPALLAMIEDSGAIEGRGEVAWRQAVMKRYEASPLFRLMLLRLSWFWGLGFLVTAIVTTILIMVLKEDVAFGVGWGLPYVWAGVYMIGTIVFVKRSLREERRLWNSKTSSGVL